jgi:hypothetical protein
VRRDSGGGPPLPVVPLVILPLAVVPVAGPLLPPVTTIGGPSMTTGLAPLRSGEELDEPPGDEATEEAPLPGKPPGRLGSGRRLGEPPVDVLLPGASTGARTGEPCTVVPMPTPPPVAPAPPLLGVGGVMVIGGARACVDGCGCGCVLVLVLVPVIARGPAPPVAVAGAVGRGGPVAAGAGT